MGVRNILMNFEEQAGKKCTVTFMSNGGREKELYIENCRCIKNCDDNYIILGVFGMDIKISGAPLLLENFGVNGVKITGNIHSLSFEEC